MSSYQSGYLLGIGSNIEPHHNIAQIIRLLLKEFSTLTASRILEIPPVGMNSQYNFLNGVVFIETDYLETNLKLVCNTIETQLGRNRSDPQRKTKDRPADLDILIKIALPNDAQIFTHSITDEYFLYPLLDEIIAYLMQKPFELHQMGVEINTDDLTFGQTATTINRNTGTCNKSII